jgi:hypothetical protein
MKFKHITITMAIMIAAMLCTVSLVGSKSAVATEILTNTSQESTPTVVSTKKFVDHADNCSTTSYKKIMSYDNKKVKKFIKLDKEKNLKVKYIKVRTSYPNKVGKIKSIKVSSTVNCYVKRTTLYSDETSTTTVIDTYKHVTKAATIYVKYYVKPKVYHSGYGVKRWRPLVAYELRRQHVYSKNIENTILHIMRGESGGNPDSVYGQHRGLFQFNSNWGSVKKRLDPEWSIRRIVKVYKVGGMSKMRQHWAATIY